MLCDAMLAMLRYAMPDYAMSSDAMLCNAMLCSGIPCHAVLFDAMLWYHGTPIIIEALIVFEVPRHEAYDKTLLNHT